jgi:ubiquinone biosynthesis protein COQ9
MTEKTVVPGIELVRERILAAALPNVPFDGWSIVLLRNAEKECGIDRQEQRRAFPLGVVDLVSYWLDTRDAAMVSKLSRADLAAMKIREKITLAVRTRLEVMTKDRIAARRALTFFSSPLQAAAGMTSLYNTVDAIWRAIGDTSSDFNFYTKRATLAGVYSATLVYWLSDDSEGFRKTWEFLDHRINDVMQIEKAKASVQELVEKLPDPFKILGSIRYPNSR